MAVEFGKMLELMIDKRAVELLFQSGQQPQIRLRKDLRPLNLPALSPEDVRRYARDVDAAPCRRELEARGARDVEILLDADRVRIRARWPKRAAAREPEAVPGELDRRLSRRLDMPLLPYGASLALARDVVAFVGGFGLLVRAGAEGLSARYGSRTFERPIPPDGKLAEEICRFILDILDGRA